MRLIRLHPPNLWSSTRPTNGEMYVAPALADRIACEALNIKVTLTLIPRSESCLQAIRPSLVQGTLIVTTS